jgi:hypothetical protein
MICPNCDSEYREGYVRCSSCDVDLVALTEPPLAEADVALVKIYESGNAALVPLFKSLMADASIEYMVKNDPIHNLFGSNLNVAIGPVEFYVREDAVDEAREIVKTLEEPTSASGELDSE